MCFCFWIRAKVISTRIECLYRCVLRMDHFWNWNIVVNNVISIIVFVSLFNTRLHKFLSIDLILLYKDMKQRRRDGQRDKGNLCPFLIFLVHDWAVRTCGHRVSKWNLEHSISSYSTHPSVFHHPSCPRREFCKEIIFTNYLFVWKISSSFCAFDIDCVLHWCAYVKYPIKILLQIEASEIEQMSHTHGNTATVIRWNIPIENCHLTYRFQLPLSLLRFGCVSISFCSDNLRSVVSIFREIPSYFFEWSWPVSEDDGQATRPLFFPPKVSISPIRTIETDSRGIVWTRSLFSQY